MRSSRRSTPQEEHAELTKALQKLAHNLEGYPSRPLRVIIGSLAEGTGLFGLLQRHAPKHNWYCAHHSGGTLWRDCPDVAIVRAAVAAECRDAFSASVQAARLPTTKTWRTATQTMGHYYS